MRDSASERKTMRLSDRERERERERKREKDNVNANAKEDYKEQKKRMIASTS